MSTDRRHPDNNDVSARLVSAVDDELEYLEGQRSRRREHVLQPDEQADLDWLRGVLDVLHLGAPADSAIDPIMRAIRREQLRRFRIPHVDIRWLRQYITPITRHPHPGHRLFLDIQALLAEHAAMMMATSAMAAHFALHQVDLVVGIEARGFIFSTPVAQALMCGQRMLRKAFSGATLPGKRISQSYSMAYGERTLEISEDAITPGSRVLIVDDVVDTGRTFMSAAKLVESVGGVVVGLSCFLEKTGKGGRARLEDYELYSVIQMDESEFLDDDQRE